MSANRLTLSLVGFVILLIAASCFLAAAAPLTGQKLVLLNALQDQDGNVKEVTDFRVYAVATNTDQTGILAGTTFDYVPDTSMPDLEAFFRFVGTLELLIKKSANTAANFVKGDIVISEIMWGLDLAESGNTVRQWIEIYNTTGRPLTIAENGDLALLFTPFENQQRASVSLESTDYIVLDTVSNLHRIRWHLPGQNGYVSDPTTGAVTSPVNYVVSAYRKIDYNKVKTGADREEQLKAVPDGSLQESWAVTPALGSRNLIDGLVGTPGEEHVASYVYEGVDRTVVPADTIVISEVRNDSSRENLDWIELINIRGVNEAPVQVDDWELSFVTAKGEEKSENQIALPRYELASGEILLIVNREPYDTLLAKGINVEKKEWERLKNGAQHKYVVRPGMSLPDSGLILLRDRNDKNGTDEAIQDYATGGGYYEGDSLEFNTGMWPLKGWLKTDGVNVLAKSRGKAFARELTYTSGKGPYLVKTGFDKEGWVEVGAQSGLGYAPGTDLRVAPGTPGYRNDALKVTVNDHNPNPPNPSEKEYTIGEISISEIMYHAGPRWNLIQWIELYNSSMTEAVNLKGWELEIRNHEDGVEAYVDSTFTFKDAVILPNQTLLLVSGTAANDVPGRRVYNLYKQHRDELGLLNRRSVLLSPIGFYLKLTDVADESDSSRDIDVVVDEVGNLSFDGVSWKVFWDLPARDLAVRRSLLRRYGTDFTPGGFGFRPGGTESPRNGILPSSWHQSSASAIRTGISFYGHRDDISTPGYRLGGPLPVQFPTGTHEYRDGGHQMDNRI